MICCENVVDIAPLKKETFHSRALEKLNCTNTQLLNLIVICVIEDEFVREREREREREVEIEIGENGFQHQGT